MKVILLKDLARLGKRFEVKDVPTGHALNFLIPRKMAEAATEESLKRLDESKKRTLEDEALTMDELQGAFKEAGKVPLEVSVEANDQGSLFKGVKAEDVSSFLNDAGILIPSEHICVDTPIKELGTHEISLEAGDLKETMTLNLVKK